MKSRKFSLLFAGFALVLAYVKPAWAENIDPSNRGSQYAHGENIGWLNAEPGNDKGYGAEVAATRLTGWIWAENIGWISLSCRNTDSCAAVDYEIRNDGAGNLSGYAWSENAGWVSFSCANTGSCRSVNYGVRIDLSTGRFRGQAWGENIGWVDFDSQSQTAYMIVTSWTDSVTYIAGRVWIEFGGHPDLSVTNATITLEGTGYSTTTDADGNFLITRMLPGTYTVMITAPNMKPLRKEVTVSFGQKLDLALPQMAVLTQTDLNKAVSDAIASWDVGGDNQIGLGEAIKALQVTSGRRSE
jgi:hypothetical protein